MRLIIAGGGTGGHLFPGIAIAQTLQQMSSHHQILFVGTDGELEKREVPKAGFQLELIRISGLKNRSFLERLEAYMQLPLAVFQSILILRRFEPDMVLGVGGYASGPVLLAAWFMRINRAICEQNSIPGWTNRVLARYFVNNIFGAFKKSGEYFLNKNFFLLGNPLRSGFLPVPPKKPEHILILGGSRGARPLNSIVPLAMAILKSRYPELPILHQTGQADYESVKEQYAVRGVKVHVVSFIDDMPKAYTEAKLAVARAGAMVCSELAAVGLPAILVPFPQATDDHQTENAKELVRAGAAILMPQAQLTAEKLAAQIELFILEPKRLEQMSYHALKIAHPRANEWIVQKLIELC